ncbi:MAG: hypothetical protein R3E01_26605 [Pirellulaceae bacterium]|nr:hypothetical protein [Planctomycetales bacterium]
METQIGRLLFSIVLPAVLLALFSIANFSQAQLLGYDDFETQAPFGDRSGKGGDGQLYIDGSAVPVTFGAGSVPSNISGGYVTPSQDFWIGRANGATSDGSIDDLAFFGLVLTPDQVRGLYDGSLSPSSIPEPATCLPFVVAFVAMQRGRRL